MLYFLTHLLTSVPDCLSFCDIPFIAGCCIVLIAIGFLNSLSKGGN